MLRYRSRSGSVDFGQKNHYSSVFSRTLSVSKLCRGDALVSQIDSDALKSLDNKPSKISNSSENPIYRIMSMQQQMGGLEEELKRTKEKLIAAEVEKDKAMEQLMRDKEEAHEANSRVNEALSTKRVRDLRMEVENLRDAVSCSRDEMAIKDKRIEALESEIGRTRRFEVDLADRELSLMRLEEELRGLEDKEKDRRSLMLENERRIQELEAQLGREKKWELTMSSSYALQTRQLEATRAELEESQVEIGVLRDKIELLEEISKLRSGNADGGNSTNSGEENVEGEKKGLLKYESLIGEVKLLKNELKLALEGEEKSVKAMEDLALALKEVVTEANQAKEKLSTTQIELEPVKIEAEQLKAMIRNADEKHQKLLDEAKQEADVLRNTADRLRLEAEETLFAWNAKEMGFVSCIKRAEEEKAVAQHQGNKLSDSLKAAENTTRAAREENYKLRDILKQAINEANAAKAAAGIARDENSQLKDCLSEKEEVLHFLSRENERLRINEAAANENVKEFKRLLSTTASTELKAEDFKVIDSPDSEDQVHENRDMKKTFSFNLEDLKFLTEPDCTNDGILDEDPEKAEALKGSIFDTNAETPKSEPHTPKTTSFQHRRGHSYAFTDDGGAEDFDNLPGTPDDSDNDRSSNRRRKTMFRRVGDLLMIRRSFSKKEPSIE